MTFDQNRTAVINDQRRTGVVAGLRSTTGAEFRIGDDSRRWSLGSSPSCDVVIEDPFVSSVHCTIERRPGGALFIRDRGSRNGTYIDSCSIEAGELRVGSHLVVGRTTLVAHATPGKVPASALEMMKGHDPVLRATIDQALKAAQADCSVLIVGETGTGKDLLARIIHEHSRRAAGKFVAVNCGAIPGELIGTELFGHEKGAFTGAMAERDGFFVEAHHGTLFLDEIAELPIDLQPHLLRALESRRVRRIGGSYERPVDVRIVSATNRMENLGTESSRLRTDIYHRLATVVLVLPPLRERMGDLAELVEMIMVELEAEHGRKKISDAGWKMLASYAWPGNVRELRGTIVRAVTLGGETLGPNDFFPAIRFGRGPALALLAGEVDGDGLVPYQAMMRGAMEQALTRFGTIRSAAHHLGMAKSTFADRARAWGLIPRQRVKQPPSRLVEPPEAEDDDDEIPAYEMTDEVPAIDPAVVLEAVND